MCVQILNFKFCTANAGEACDGKVAEEQKSGKTHYNSGAHEKTLLDSATHEGPAVFGRSPFGCGSFCLA